MFAYWFIIKQWVWWRNTAINEMESSDNEIKKFKDIVLFCRWSRCNGKWYTTVGPFWGTIPVIIVLKILHSYFSSNFFTSFFRSFFSFSTSLTEVEMFFSLLKLRKQALSWERHSSEQLFSVESNEMEDFLHEELKITFYSYSLR